MNKEEIKEKLISQIKDTNYNVTAKQLNTMNLYELNIDSLSIMRVISYWMKNGYKVNFAQFMKAPFINSWAEIIINAEIKENKAVTQAKGNENLISDKEPFDLTDVQYAYWVGRNESQYLGGVGCHGYMEVRCFRVDVDRLEASWGAVQNTHAMLRARYTDDGKQCICEKPYSTKVLVDDLRGLSEAEKETYILEKREKLSHRLLKISEGQVAALQLTRLTDTDYIMHFDIDLLICDVLSFKIILRDLAVYYKKGTLPDLSWWNFAQYLKDHKLNTAKLREEDEAFWLSKIDSMPNGPKLMLRPGVEKIKYPRFKRRSVHYSAADWESIKNEAARNRLTVAMILLTAYARTIANWSENKKFLLNLPLFSRDDFEGIDQVVADFTNIVLVEMDFTVKRTFIEDALFIQKRFLENAAHTCASGVWVTRQLQKRRGNDARIPVVFSCNLGEPLLSEEFVEEFGPLDYMISQTPQVWIDFQAFDEDGGLTLLWDGIEEIFRDGMLNEMFDFFKKELDIVISGIEAVDKRVLSVLEEKQVKNLEESKAFKAAEETLHEKILKQAEISPDKIAVKNVDTGKEVTYSELRKRALSIVTGLKACREEGDLIALFLPRSESEVIAALGVLSSGRGYIPIHVDQAEKRLYDMLSSDRILAVITDVKHMSLATKYNKQVFCYEELLKNEPSEKVIDVAYDATAYVIYTSGTTGKPKGVEIAHNAAVNTINEVNRICNVSDKDSILNVSSYDFDLSVYDFWGLLREGGRLLVLSQKSWRDAERWLEVIKDEKVTLWNSVPMLFKMLLVEAEEKNEKLEDMRVSMLSGDWIDMDIPKRFAAISCDSYIMAMGGATEASIWSNYKIVKGDVDKDWISIPYGKALPQQIYRVVDEAGNDCPCYVPGELWIGGAGVAQGYLGDEELTDKKFISDEYGKWYRTGDMGCFWNDGTIEFLGRQDRQVKFRGHRIELGEIENAIDKVEVIDKSYVDIINLKDTKALVAYVALNDKKAPDIIHEIAGIVRKDVSEKDYIDILNRDNDDAVKDDQRMYYQYVAQKLKEIRKRIDIDKVSEEYLPLLHSWDEIKCENADDIKVPEKIEKFVSVFTNNINDILEGNISVGDLVLLDDFVEVEEVLTYDKQSQILSDLLLRSLSNFTALDDNNVEILIIDSGSKEFINAVKATFNNVNCTVMVSSDYYVNRLKDKLNDSVNVIRMGLDTVHYELMKRYDIIICNQSLHRFANVNVALQNLECMLKEGGYLYFAESSRMTALANITTVFLRKEYTDLRKDSLSMLIDHKSWKEILNTTSLSIVEEIGDDITYGGFSYFGLINNGNSSVTVKNSSFISEHIRNMVPEYMIPKHYIFLSRVPMSANGKIDRKALLAMRNDADNEEADDEVKYTKTEERLSEIWRGILKVKPRPDDNYFMLGGDSLLATVLKNEIKKELENEISLETIFLKPVLKEMAKELDMSASVIKDTEKLPVLIKDDTPYEPFELTDMQQSYLIGRSGAFKLGDYSSHCYFEMDCDILDRDRLENSWNEVIKIHDMMRAVVCDDNLHQRVLEEVPHYEIKKIDLTELSGDALEESLLKIRHELEHQTFDLYKWPAYDIRYAEFGSRSRIFISFDNLFFDGWSMFYIFRQWKALYEDPDVRIDKADITFKEYVLSLNENRKGESYEKDLEYWKNKLDNISGAPELPVNKESSVGTFKRFSTHLKPEKWEALKNKIRNYSLTEPVFLMSLYAEVIARYSRDKKFSINLTRFNRIPFSEKVDQVVGDFTTLTILSLDLTTGQSFEERAKEIQKVLWSDISHSSVSGVHVERMLNKNKQSDVVMPVVFTSGIGLTEDRTTGENSYLGKLGYGLSQTPQVWLDMQVYNDATGLYVSLDAVEELFPQNMVADMFSEYERLLNVLSKDETLWNKETGSIVESSDRSMIEAINATQCRLDKRTLVDGIKDIAVQNPEKVAVVHKGTTYSYQYVYDKAKIIAQNLVKEGVGANTPVAILMHKSPEQIIAALGIMMAKGAYLPLNAYHPVSRNKRILELANVKLIMTGAGSESDEYASDFDIININQLDTVDVELPMISEDTLAYIIYTSGTTGEPKGVAITHGGAMNTIIDINNRIKAEENDATIALSQMNFDLSVYDIFGMLEVGGCIVIPEADRAIEPSYIAKLCKDEKVTIWNSVPAYIQMVLEYGNSNDVIIPDIRHILLSGDWIPVDIKEQAKNVMTSAVVHGLGGATEASIWSNWHTVTDEDSKRTSIPYGVPLANQTMYILNKSMEPVPYNVPGDLYIGGKGLALGYWNNEELTKKSFIDNAYQGMRIYKTGDLAMYSPEGFIVFLGREDGQVKIGGYRIEIGEIESAIRRVTRSDNAVVVNNNQLHAFICTCEDLSQLKAGLREILPEYMIPEYMHSISGIPLSPNGKVDRKTLTGLCDKKEENRAQVSPSSDYEIKIADIWKNCLQIDEIYVDDNFFQLGGDSLKAVMIINEIKKEFYVELSITSIFECPTIGGLSEILEDQIGGMQEGEI